MTDSHLDAAAAWIAERRSARRSLADMPATLKPSTEDAAYAVQARVRDLLEPAFGPTIGWKVGATTAAMQKLLNVPAPCFGEMHRGGLHHRSAKLESKDFCRLGIECEIAMELAAPLGGSGAVTPEMAAAAVVRIFPAAEIVDDRYGDFRSFGVPALIADFFFHAGVVLGAPIDDWRRLDLAEVAGTTRVNGEARVTGRGADVLGHPMRSLAILANRVSALGRRLEAGQIVMTGSLPLPYWTSPGDIVSVELAGLGEVAITVA
jgi:2-keto-4-pentenoate hydratase